MSKEKNRKTIDIAKYRIKKEKNFSLLSIETNDKQGLEKSEGKDLLKANRKEMFDLQEKLYAENEQGLLIIFQAMDAAGKDGAIKHVMRGLNPQGTHVTAFKAPSEEEIDRDYLWRINRALPRRGEIGIFNRSHYEEVVVAQLHNLVKEQSIPDELIGDDLWQNRYEQINNWEKYLSQQGFTIIKIFLHLSKDEQKERLLDRIYEEEKNWKFSSSDINERQHWDEYQALYEKMLQYTAKDYAPWYVVPADRKWYARACVSQIVKETLEKMNPKTPELSPEEKAKLSIWQEVLENDGLELEKDGKILRKDEKKKKEK